MYKIYINRAPLVLSHTPPTTPDSSQLVARYSGRPKTLLHYVDMMEKGRRFQQVVLFYDDAAKLFQDFCAHFRVVEAAGGIVYNERQEILLIFRRGIWDLPKGHLDPGETPEQAALREVQEETGLQELVLHDFASMTYHTFRDRQNQRILKSTHWFRMYTRQTELHLQAEEDIEQASWAAPETFAQLQSNMFESISELLSHEWTRIKT